MDAEQTIAEIEWLERIFAAPDTRPLSASDLWAESVGRLSLQFRLVGVRETQGGSTPHTAAKAETTAVREHFVVPSIHKVIVRLSLAKVVATEAVRSYVTRR